LAIELFFRIPVSTTDGRTTTGADMAAALTLELCRVERPLMRAAFCTQPLYGLEGLKRRLPWMLDDWLAYHLDFFGFDHAEIYDVDGTFKETVMPHWLRRKAAKAHETSPPGDAEGRMATLTYHSSFLANLSASLAGASRQHPYCTEMLAYAHCLTTHRALSRWVMLLHAPDEYAFVPAGKGRPRPLGPALDFIERELPLDEAVGMSIIDAASFARGGGSAQPTEGWEEEAANAAPGGIVDVSRLRSPIYYRHTPLIDPTQCSCAGAHTCYAESHSDDRALAYPVSPSIMVVHHYVEMLSQNRGRCANQHGTCSVFDDSAAWLVPLLREVR